MRFISERARWRTLVVAVALLSVTVLVTASAGAAVNDDFAASTTDGCGVATAGFVLCRTVPSEHPVDVGGWLHTRSERPATR